MYKNLLRAELFNATLLPLRLACELCYALAQVSNCLNAIFEGRVS
jgi:hypothetical protein